MADRALHFLRRLGHRLEQCVDWVLAGPSDELLGVLPHRPHLSHGMARRRLVSRLYRDLAATSQASAWPRSPTSTSRDDPLSPGHELAAKLARTFGRASMREFAALWLDLLPELPAMHLSGCTLRLLRSLDCVVRLGRALRNCLAKTDAVVDYLAESICLVAVETEEGAPVGLVSVALERCGSRIVREVREAVGPGNEPLANSLVTAAEAYVDRMARDAAAFECFVRVGEAVARLGDSESG